MKKIILLSFTFFYCLSMLAQTSHLKFMGIPINGTIESFQAKLKTKGVTAKRDNASLPNGIRGFNGTFAGEKCKIYVYYNTKSKVVYQCRVIVSRDTKELALSVLEYYKNLFKEKYEGRCLTSDLLEENPEPEKYSLVVIEEPVEVGSKVLGIIYLDIIEYDYNMGYGLRIDYEDFTNSETNKKSNMNDL